MHVYVAAPWTAKDEARKFALKLEDKGHDITERWWEHREVESYPCIDDISSAERAELQDQALRDLAGIDDADVVVVLQLAKSEGKAAETGYAINSEKPVIVLAPDGVLGNLFQILDSVIVVRSETEVFEALTALEAEMLAFDLEVDVTDAL